MQREIGEGGMAELWLVHHKVLGSVHALKMLKPECARRARIRNRFLAEGRVQAQLRHRHIVAVTDVVSDEGFAALVMDFIPGGTLSERLHRARQNLSPREACEVLLPLLDALEFAHSKGVIHRDLKPDNILFRDPSWRDPVISDFGIAKLADDAEITGTRANPTRTGVTMGTPGYMAPEQIKGARSVGPSADVFSMGVIAWEMVTGAPPFSGRTEYEVMDRIVQGHRPSLDEVGASLHAAFKEVLERAVATDADLRYPTSRAFADALRAAVSVGGAASDERLPFKPRLIDLGMTGGDSDAGETLLPVGSNPTLMPTSADPYHPTLMPDEEQQRRLGTRSGTMSERSLRDSGGVGDPPNLRRRPPPDRTQADRTQADRQTGPDPLRHPPARQPDEARPPSRTGPSRPKTQRRSLLAGSMFLVLGVTAAALVGTGQVDPTSIFSGSDPKEQRAYRGVGGPTLRAANYELIEVNVSAATAVGSSSTERGRDADEAQGTAQLDRFAIGTTEVTQALWTKVMGSNPVETAVPDWGGKVRSGAACNRFGPGEDHPVYCVSWLEAVGFLNELSRRDGLKPAYVDEGGSVRWVKASTGYRLPTEAEWEVAARADTTAAYGPATRVNQLCEFANVPGGWTSFWYSDFEITESAPCSDGVTAVAPVAAFAPNAWGLHDMIGNVAEWTWDPYEARGVSVTPVGQRPLRTPTVVRGGAWQSNLEDLRVADRVAGEPHERSWVVGFRIARSL